MSLVLNASRFVLPLVLFVFAYILFTSRNKSLVDSFTEGAFDGAKSCFELLPALLLVMCGVSALFSSGAVDILYYVFMPLLKVLGVPRQLMPAVILRPFSGSAVTAVADKLFSQYGADSGVSKIAAVLMGSTDTIIYTLGVYFSAAHIKKTRYALPASFVVFVFSILVCTYFGKRML